MLNVFTLANGRLFQEEIDSLDELTPARPVWVDLEDPTPEEKGWIAVRFGLVIPADIIDDFWLADASGPWSDDADWSVGVPGADDDAELTPSGTTPFAPIVKKLFMPIHSGRMAGSSSVRSARPTASSPSVTSVTRRNLLKRAASA